MSLSDQHRTVRFREDRQLYRVVSALADESAVLITPFAGSDSGNTATWWVFCDEILDVDVAVAAQAAAGVWWEFDSVFGLIPNELRKAWAAPIECRAPRETPVPPPRNHVNAPPALCSDKGDNSSNSDDEIMLCDGSTVVPVAESGSKKSKRKKHKKKKAPAPAAASAEPLPPPSPLKIRKSVSFGSVHARVLPRGVGGSAVPGGGGWALSFDHDAAVAHAAVAGAVTPPPSSSSSPASPSPTTVAAIPKRPSQSSPVTAPEPAAPLPQPADVLLGTVDDFEAAKALEVEERMKALSKKDRKLATGETRQLCHRSNSDNPLFRRLSEPDRRALLSRELEHKPDLAQLNLQESAEFSLIRQSRDAVGCNCHPVAQDIKKYSQKRIKQELISRGADPNGSKADITERLRALCAADVLCSKRAAPGMSAVVSPSLSPMDRPSTCSCAEAGIQCHPQVCRCCRFVCGNPSGVSTYDAVAVKTFRKAVLSATRSPCYIPSGYTPAVDSLPDMTLPPPVADADTSSVSPDFTHEIGDSVSSPPRTMLSSACRDGCEVGCHDSLVTTSDGLLVPSA